MKNYKKYYSELDTIIFNILVAKLHRAPYRSDYKRRLKTVNFSNGNVQIFIDNIFIQTIFLKLEDQCN